MAAATSGPEPSRPTEIARLELARLAPDASLARVFALGTELAAKAIGVERVGVWLFIDNRTALRCADLYELSKDEHSAGSVLRVADFPNYFGSLTIRKAVPAEIAISDPRTAELAAGYLLPLGISSMLDAGMFVDGELVGVVCHEHVGKPREWTTEARDFAGSVADLLALRIQSGQVQELRTAFRTQKDRLAAIDKAEALEQMASEIAHDFNNLLTVVLGHGELLNNNPDLPEPGRKHAHAILEAAQSGVALVKELRDFASPTVRPPVVMNLANATDEFLPLLRAAVGRKHKLRFKRPALIGSVLIDKTQFTRVLLNLAVNAREAMQDGGTIVVRLAPVKLTIGDELAGHYVMLEVSDTGAGMDEATRRRALEPFFTTKSKGSGLGLSIVNRIVDLVGGLIRIESAPGRGTTIRIFFPRVGASSGGTGEFVVPPELTTRNHPS